MLQPSKLLRSERIVAYTQIILGCLLGALAYPMFLVPNSIAPGGITGIATILNHLFHTPVGLVSLLFNVPLFILSYRSMGRLFVVRSLFATVLFSVLIDIVPVPAVTQDALLGSVFGGVMLGVALGLIFRGGATTGGSDMVARIIRKRFQHISTGMILLGLDFVVIVAAGFLIKVEYALYALISIYISSKLIDVVFEGFSRQKACYVISSQPELIRDEVMEKLSRGVTLFKAQGGYSGEERMVLLCLLSAQEVVQLKTIVRLTDEKAFLFITDAHEVLGEGFRKLED